MEPDKEKVERDCNTCRHHRQEVVPGSAPLSSVHTIFMLHDSTAYWHCVSCLNDPALPSWEPLEELTTPNR